MLKRVIVKDFNKRIFVKKDLEKSKKLITFANRKRGILLTKRVSKEKNIKKEIWKERIDFVPLQSERGTMKTGFP